MGFCIPVAPDAEQRVKTDWRSYDRIAVAYERAAERQCFVPPARDLVALLGLVPGSRVLDAGAGTGAVAALATAAVGASGLVVALDPAIDMLQVLRARCNARPVIGRLPMLPHPDGSFDAVAAAFVLTHLDDPDGAVVAMAKALRPGGRLAASSWAQSEARTPPGKSWKAVASQYVRDEEIEAALRTSLPLQDRFSDSAALEAALAAAGLVEVSAREFTYAIRMPAQAFAELRQISMTGRFIETVLSPREWERFKEAALRRLADEHGAEVNFQVRANIATGSKLH